jgi:hypothetical protein
LTLFFPLPQAKSKNGMIHRYEDINYTNYNNVFIMVPPIVVHPVIIINPPQPSFLSSPMEMWAVLAAGKNQQRHMTLTPDNTNQRMTS